MPEYMREFIVHTVIMLDSLSLDLTDHAAFYLLYPLNFGMKSSLSDTLPGNKHIYQESGNYRTCCELN